VLPNDVKANLAGCFVIGNATGGLAKERVEIQLVSISCVDFDERSVVDQPIKGFFVDTDGKKGLSGKVVTRAGAALARAFIAGTITGIAIGREYGRCLDLGARRCAASMRAMPPRRASQVVSTIVGQAHRLLSRPCAAGRPDRRGRRGQGCGRGDPGGVTLEIKPTAGAKF
jgi:conjugal transfer pilus assembly protein TraB